ncbi:hypothetical protein J2T60_001594 [Natronospira proteinivora]|uniref:Uncharacterized protein n=1 Tax=Natronospira proteinivora TaxID=1807133 RepID=A0ABT1G8F0_9GAMM|nr:hypothetical protein [Natronospira proteinivora]MCP1727594.1 hypothetical protein [Natronospira proteinivora]
MHRMIRHAAIHSLGAVSIATILLTPVPVVAEESVSQDRQDNLWQTGIDIRSGLYASEQESRTGETSSNENWRTRLRFHAERSLSPTWTARGRIAGVYTNDQDQSSAFLRAHAPTRSGLRPGDTTVDELHLGWQPLGADWSLRFGRFQSRAGIPVVPAKGIDRKDSSNVGVSWTDGIEADYRLTDHWQGQTRLHYNHRRGSGSVHRAPLDYSDSGSRIGLTQKLENTQPLGPVVLRRLTLTWEPDSLASYGLDDPRREDYLSLTASGAASWAIGDTGTDFLLAGELGQVRHRPQATVIGSGDQGRADSSAWQLSANLEQFLPGHRIGVVYGRAGGGWLHSVDYRNNDALFEIRHQYRFNPTWSMESRFRMRRELEIPVDTSSRRTGQDIYIRFTGRIAP